MQNGTIPFIRCPKTHCGCGLCVPKSSRDDVAEQLFKYHAPGVTPVFMEGKKEEDLKQKGTLKSVVFKFDVRNGNHTREKW